MLFVGRLFVRVGILPTCRTHLHDRIISLRVELFRQCGILELFRQCGIFFSFDYKKYSSKYCYAQQINVHNIRSMPCICEKEKACIGNVKH